MEESSALPFPIVGEISEGAWDQVAEGQPVLLLRNGRPAAVIVDLKSWEEAELAASQGAWRALAPACAGAVRTGS